MMSAVQDGYTRIQDISAQLNSQFLQCSFTNYSKKGDDVDGWINSYFFFPPLWTPVRKLEWELCVK